MSHKPMYEKLEKQIAKLKIAEHDLKIAQQRLSEEIAWRRLLIEQSRDGIVVLDQNGKVFEANKQFAAILGYSLEEMQQLHVWDWDYQFSREELLALAASVDISGHHFETQQRRRDGTIVDVEPSNNGIWFGGKKFILCIVRDITSQKKAQAEKENLFREIKGTNARLEEIATRDALTCVFNRHWFKSCYAREIGRAQRNGSDICLLVIDIDHFKRVNDRFGHLCGDDCLVKVARTIGENLGQPGDFLARYGGDEFVALLPDTSLPGAEKVAERIRNDVEKIRVECESQGVGLTVSIGVACLYVGGSLDGPSLFSRADIALYTAKSQGGNRVAADRH